MVGKIDWQRGYYEYLHLSRNILECCIKNNPLFLIFRFCQPVHNARVTEVSEVYMCEHLFRLYTKCPAENTIKQHQQYLKGWINWASKPKVCLLAWIKYKKLHQKKKKNDDLQTQSLYTIILIAFYGFKRSSKVSSLCRSDSRFKGTLIKIFIQKSKTRVQKRQLVVFIFL